MKALIRKEMREAAGVGLLGLVVILLAIAGEFLALRRALALDVGPFLPPLQLSLQVLAVVCSVLPAVLGWLQIFRERQRNLWGFLIHRPVTPAAIWTSKSIAGLSVFSSQSPFRLEFTASGRPRPKRACAL
jgi:hypothetical protein